MPLYVRIGMQALYHGREQARVLGMKRVEELLKVRRRSLSGLALLVDGRERLKWTRTSATIDQAGRRIRLADQRDAAHRGVRQDVCDRHERAARTRPQGVQDVQRVLLRELRRWAREVEALHSERHFLLSVDE